MGSSHSVEIPGGGTEGYHVLRVRGDLSRLSDCLKSSYLCEALFIRKLRVDTLIARSIDNAHVPYQGIIYVLTQIHNKSL